MPDTAETSFDWLRERMVEDQLVARGISDSRVLAAMKTVPRHQFVPTELIGKAYGDGPLPIGFEQTISQPYVVAYCCELAKLDSQRRVLEVGTGCGYQAAVLSELCGQVFSVEVIPELAISARERLEKLAIDNVEVACRDGSPGWSEHAPFDAIVVAAAAPTVPVALTDQLRPGGRLVIPVGTGSQQLMLIEKDERGELHQRSMAAVGFVPLVSR